MDLYYTTPDDSGSAPQAELIAPCLGGVFREWRDGDAGSTAGARWHLWTWRAVAGATAKHLPGRRPQGSSFGTRWLPARQPIVRDDESRGPVPTGADMARDGLRLKKISRAHGQQHVRWTGRVRSCSERLTTLAERLPMPEREPHHQPWPESLPGRHSAGSGSRCRRNCCEPRAAGGNGAVA